MALFDMFLVFRSNTFLFPYTDEPAYDFPIPYTGIRIRLLFLPVPPILGIVKPVFEYIDFRAYLKDIHLAGKQETPPLSYRSFARKLGFTSPNFLKLVIDGERN